VRPEWSISRPNSYFNLISSHPPFVMYSSNTRKHRRITAKARRVRLQSRHLRAPQRDEYHRGNYPADVSEPEVAKLAMAPSRIVKAAAVAAAPVALECLYVQTVPVVGGKRQEKQL